MISFFRHLIELLVVFIAKSQLKTVIIHSRLLIIFEKDFNFDTIPDNFLAVLMLIHPRLGSIF